MAKLYSKATQLEMEEEEEEIIIMDCSSVVCLFHRGGWGRCGLKGFTGLESFLPLSSEISLKSGREICYKQQECTGNNVMSPLDFLPA